MAELLPVVERLDPERLAERIWLVAASRAPSVPEPTPFEVAETFALAMRVARYDRAVADVIAAPALERCPTCWPTRSAPTAPPLRPILKSLAVYDPRAIAPLLRDLPDAARKPPPKANAWTAASFEAQLRLAAAQILGLPNEARPREAGRVGDRSLPYRQATDRGWTRQHGSGSVGLDTEESSMSIASSANVGRPAWREPFASVARAAGLDRGRRARGPAIPPGPQIRREADPRSPEPGAALDRARDDAAEVPRERDGLALRARGGRPAGVRVPPG